MRQFRRALWIIEVMEEEFYRIKRLPPYVINEVNDMRAAARAAGRDIIDLGMGNPDLPPPQHVIDKLCEVAIKPDAHGYSASKGIPGVRKAQANYYARRFGVELDPATEVVMTMGSKEGLASLATALPLSIAGVGVREATLPMLLAADGVDRHPRRSSHWSLGATASVRR